jgi:hypothetical protein
MLTINNIDEAIKQVSTSHPRVKTYKGVKEQWLVNAEHDNQYLLVFAQMQPSTISRTEGAVVHTIRLWVMDRVLKGLENQTDVLSDTQQVLIDIVAAFRANYRESFRLENDITCTPFQDLTDDEVTGWYGDLNIGVPIDCNYVIGKLTCEPATIELNGDSFLIVPSGSSSNITLIYQTEGLVNPISVIGNVITLPDPAGPCADATINLNSNPFLQVISGGFANITLVDENGDPITPLSVTGTQIEIQGGTGPCADATAELFFDNELIDSIQIPSNATGGFSIDCNTPLDFAVRVESTQLSHQHTGTFKEDGQINGKPKYVKIGDTDRFISYNGTQWQLEKIGGGAHVHLAAPGNEQYPWEANWTDAYLTVTQATIGTYCSNGGNAFYVLKDSAGNVLETGSIAPGATKDITAPDATYNLDNSEGSTLFLGSIPSGDNETIIAPDGTVTLNGGAFLSVASGGSVDVTTVDQNNNTLTPTVTGSELKITLPQDTLIRLTFEAGQTDSVLYTIVNNVNNGSYTVATDDGGSGTITFSINSGAFAAFSSPLVLAAGDTIQVRRTTATAQGFVQITGTY